MMIQEVFELLKRDAVAIYNEDSLLEKLNSNKKLKIKLGADPSRPDLHLGHSVVLRKMKLLQDLGHEVIFVIGDFTGMIGDPSGKSKTRVPLTFEETRKNAESYLKQVTKILDPNKTIITYNSNWLSKMNFAEVLQLAGKYTVARIMERDDFSKRFTTNQPIGIHELFYPLMQGYDSVELKADIEIGGTDQTFNLLVGRELQRDYNQSPQEVMTFPLLIGLDGKEKMSKSLDNYIGIDESPELMFEKCMKVSDSLLLDYFRLTTDLDEHIFQTMINNDIREAHFLYASTIVKMYHGDEFDEMAKARYIEISKGLIPQSMNNFDLIKAPISIVNLLKTIGFTTSNGESKRLIQGGGIKINNKTITDSTMEIVQYDNFVISKGKNKFIQINFN